MVLGKLLALAGVLGGSVLTWEGAVKLRDWASTFGHAYADCAASIADDGECKALRAIGKQMDRKSTIADDGASVTLPSGL